MRVIFLGTNGWYNTQTGNTICVLVETKDNFIIFDAGEGLYKIDRFIKDKRPIHLFLSHLHMDHISGLHAMAKFNFQQGINIYGYKGIKVLLDGIMRPPYSASFSKLPYRVEVIELEEGRHNLNFSIETLPLLHSVESFGYRLEADGRTVTYCCDTGPCPNALRLAKDADIFIAECSLRSGEHSPSWPHLNPESAAKIAKDSGAKRLVLTHFNPFLFASFRERDIAQQEASNIFSDSISAKDDLEIIC